MQLLNLFSSVTNQKMMNDENVLLNTFFQWKQFVFTFLQVWYTSVCSCNYSLEASDEFPFTLVWRTCHVSAWRPVLNISWACSIMRSYQLFITLIASSFHCFMILASYLLTFVFLHDIRFSLVKDIFVNMSSQTI